MSVSRSVRRSIRRSIRRSVTLYFSALMGFLALLLLPKCSTDLEYGPCPPARDWGSRVSGLIFITGQSFIQSEIDAGLIQYRHVGIGGQRDLIKLDVTDGFNPLIDRCNDRLID